MGPPPSEYVSNVWKNGIFDNRVVFVTGGAGTICSAQTRALVYLGANACIIGRNAKKTEAAAKDLATARPGAKVIGIGDVDVRSFDSLKAAADRCAAELGSIDFVIAGAAGNFVAPISGLTPNGFRTVLEIDTIGTFNTVKATVPYLLESVARNGKLAARILAVSATFHYTGQVFQSHVSAAKAGVDSLMASVALEYGPLGISANIIAPGAVAGSEGMERLASAMADASKMDAAVPSGRIGTVRDIADATVYLFSDAGTHVNGHNLVVDGAAWRRQGGASSLGLDEGMQYPNFLQQGTFSKHVKSGRKDAKL